MDFLGFIGLAQIHVFAGWIIWAFSFSISTENGIFPPISVNSPEFQAPYLEEGGYTVSVWCVVGWVVVLL